MKKIIDFLKSDFIQVSGSNALLFFDITVSCEMLVYVHVRLHVWKYGELGTSLILGFMHAYFIESKRYALPSVFICLLCSVSFPICFHAQCFY